MLETLGAVNSRSNCRCSFCMTEGGDACRAPLMKSVLLYGAPSTGKTSLCQSIAHAAGANFFDLSPRNTDAKYPGKAVALMIHMVGEPSAITFEMAAYSHATLGMMQHSLLEFCCLNSSCFCKCSPDRLVQHRLCCPALASGLIYTEAPVSRVARYSILYYRSCVQQLGHAQ